MFDHKNTDLGENQHEIERAAVVRIEKTIENDPSNLNAIFESIKLEIDDLKAQGLEPTNSFMLYVGDRTKELVLDINLSSKSLSEILKLNSQSLKQPDFDENASSINSLSRELIDVANQLKQSQDEHDSGSGGIFNRMISLGNKVSTLFLGIKKQAKNTSLNKSLIIGAFDKENDERSIEDSAYGCFVNQSMLMVKTHEGPQREISQIPQSHN